MPLEQITESNDAPLGADKPPFLVSNGRTMAWLTREFTKGLEDLDVSLTQYRILMLLSDGEEMSSALATRLAVSPPSVTSVVEGLVSRGLVSRTHDRGDRRRIALGLTKEGKKTLAQADRAADALLIDIAASLGDAKKTARLLGSFRLWSDALAVRRRMKKAAKA